MLRDRSGATAIEFAMVAPIFFLIMLGLLEIGITYGAQAQLQYAANEAARQVRTGQVQGNALTQQEFRTLICDNISPLLSCGNDLQIDMNAYNNFGAASFPSPFLGNGALNPGLNHFNPGGPCSVVLLRVFYTWHIDTPMIGEFIANLPHDTMLMTATAAFRNEPYTSGVAGC